MIKVNLIEGKFYASEDNEPGVTEFFCRVCARDVDEGYICESNKSMIHCLDCGKKFRIDKSCKHDLEGFHSHLKFTRMY